MAFQLLQDCNDMACDMTSTEHAVLMVLCRYANEDGGDCFPSTSEIARCSHFAENPVRKALVSLQEAGWIAVSQLPGKKRFFSIAAPRIKAAVKRPADQQGVSDQQPLADQQGVSDQQPLADQQADPLQINKGTPCRSASRKEHIKEQEENIIHAAPATSCTPAENCGTAFAETVEDFGLDDFSLQPESKPEPVKAQKPKKAKEAKKTSAPHPLSFESLPDDWRSVCEQMHPDGNPDSIWAEFRFYWLSGKGAGTRRVDKGWATTWANWVRRCAERSYGRPVQQTNNAFAPIPKPKPGQVMCKPWFADDEPANDEAADMVERMMK